MSTFVLSFKNCLTIHLDIWSSVLSQSVSLQVFGRCLSLLQHQNKPVVCTKTCYGNKAAKQKHEKIAIAQMNEIWAFTLNLSLYLFSRIMTVKGFLGFRDILFALEANETNTSTGEVKSP